MRKLQIYDDKFRYSKFTTQNMFLKNNSSEELKVNRVQTIFVLDITVLLDQKYDVMYIYT